MSAAAVSTLIALALTSTVACADYPVSSDPSGGLPDVVIPNASFATDVQPLFTARCAVGGCHSAATHQAGLVLSADASYAALVNAPATRSVGAVRVRPFRSDSSWLIAMIGPDASRRHGLSRMPLAGRPLTGNQITTIAGWIDAGARRD
jgi:hypothetical protein